MAPRTVMNRKLQRLKYLILDSFSAAIAWVLFFSYRKEIVEPQLFGSDVPFLFNSQFWLGVVSITLFWLVLYFLSGYYKNVYRKSRLIELWQTLLQSFVGVLVIFFVAILDDFQNVSQQFVDIEKLSGRYEIKIFSEPFEDEADAIEKLSDFEALLVMRERTPITKNIIENLSKLKFPKIDTIEIKGLEKSDNSEFLKSLEFFKMNSLFLK